VAVGAILQEDASQLGRARGDDQDGRRILVPNIVAQSLPAAKAGRCFVFGKVLDERRDGVGAVGKVL
jgi:hypothetical protein